MEKSADKEEALAENILNILNILDPNKELLSEEVFKNTPKRLANVFIDFSQGFSADIDSIVGNSIFEANNYDDIIIIKDIDFSSLCEHHLLPFFGKIDIGYIPNEKILGLSKFPRIVEAISAKFTLQERLTQELAEIIDKYLNTKGVIVVMNAKHSCMSFRGIKSMNSFTKTVNCTGAFKGNNSENYINRFFQLSK